MTKRGRRDGNPDNPHNWRIVCSECAAEWPSDETIELVQGHHQQEHGSDVPVFSLVWRGIGPQPKRGYKRPSRGGRHR